MEGMEPLKQTRKTEEERRRAQIEERIRRAQARAKKYLKPGTSLVDELLADRREWAKREG